MKFPIKLHTRVKYYRKTKFKGGCIVHGYNSCATLRNHIGHRIENNTITYYSCALWMQFSCTCF